MFEQLKYNAFINGSSAAGIHCRMHGAEMQFSVILLKKKKGSLEITGRFPKLGSLDEVLQNVPKGMPICISYDGRGVIHKKLILTGQESDITILKQVLPNVQPEDFVYQKTKIDGNQYFVSIARKDALKKISEAFIAKGRFLVQVSLGPFAINSILTLIDDPGSDIIANEFSIDLQGGRVADFLVTQQEQSHRLYKIGGDGLYEADLLPFAACFRFYFPEEDSLSGTDDSLIHNNEFFYKQLFVKAGWSMILVLLAVLLLNFYYFDQYNNSHSDLYDKVSRNKGLLQRLDTLQSELKTKEEFIGKSGFLKNTRHSWYADFLAASLPQQLILTELDIRPLKKKLKENSEPVFDGNTIRIFGLSQKSTSLNDWIRELRSQSWVYGVTILNYKQDVSSGPASFELELALIQE